MKRRHLLAALLACMTAIVWVWLERSSSPIPDEPVGRPSDAKGAPTLEGRGSFVADLPLLPGPEAPGARSIVGQALPLGVFIEALVLSESDQPQAGADVRLDAFWAGEVSTIARRRTGMDGVARFENIPPAVGEGIMATASLDLWESEGKFTPLNRRTVLRLRKRAGLEFVVVGPNEAFPAALIMRSMDATHDRSPAVDLLDLPRAGTYFLRLRLQRGPISLFVIGANAYGWQATVRPKTTSRRVEAGLEKRARPLTILGRETRRPLTGATLYILNRPVSVRLTDQRGVTDCLMLPGLNALDFGVRVDGVPLCTGRELRVADDGAVELLIDDQQLGTRVVPVTVTDEEGNPILGAEISTTSSLGWRGGVGRSFTDHAGRAMVRTWPGDGASRRVYIAARGFAPNVAELDQPDVLVRMRHVSPRTVRAVCKEGRPIAYPMIWMKHRSEEPALWISQVGDADGLATIWPGADSRVMARRLNGVASSDEVWIGALSPAADPVDLVVPSDPDQTIRVDCVPEVALGWSLELRSGTEQSDVVREGAGFVVRGVFHERVEMHLLDPKGIVRGAYSGPPAERILIRVEQSCRVELQLVGARLDDRVVTRVEAVRADPASHLVLHPAVIDGHLVFVLPGGGTWQLELTAPEAKGRLTASIPRAAEAVRLELPLRGMGTIRIGLPAALSTAGVSVQLIERRRPRDGPSGLRPALADRRRGLRVHGGEVVVDDVAAGSYDLLVFARSRDAGIWAGGTETLRIAGGRTAIVSLRMEELRDVTLKAPSASKLESLRVLPDDERGWIGVRGYFRISKQPGGTLGAFIWRGPIQVVDERGTILFRGQVMEDDVAQLDAVAGR